MWWRACTHLWRNCAVQWYHGRCGCGGRTVRAIIVPTGMRSSAAFSYIVVGSSGLQRGRRGKVPLQRDGGRRPDGRVAQPAGRVAEPGEAAVMAEILITAAPTSKQGMATATTLEVIYKGEQGVKGFLPHTAQLARHTVAIVAKIGDCLPNTKVARMIAQAAKVTTWAEIIGATV
jgi:hypothetical protein